CSRCGVEKPLNTDFFHRSKKDNKTGFKSECKKCRNTYNTEYSKIYYKNNRKKIRGYYKKRYYDNDEQYKCSRGKMREYYKKNIDKVYKRFYEYNKNKIEYIRKKKKRINRTEEGCLYCRMKYQIRISRMK